MSARLISVHFPKAAGTSLASVYEAALGEGRLLLDYDHDPVDPCGLINLDPARYEAAKPTSLGPYAAVHGHFHCERYSRIADAVRVVVLREPVENLISIYHYWDFRRCTGDVAGDCLYRYFCSSGIGLLDLATIPAMRYLMSGVYFRGADMGRFDTIGDSRDLEGFLRRVTRLVGVEFAVPPRLNVTPQPDERQAAVADHPQTLARLRELLAADLNFYEHWANR